jgi:acyl-CoA synthetase (AMP-forming)/AMP-acid ligase II
VLQNCAEHGDKVAFVDAATDQKLSFLQLKLQVMQAAGGLMASGFKPGDVLLTNATNCLEYPVLVHAVTLLGGIVSPASPMFLESEVATQIHAVENVGTLFLATIPAVAPPALAAADACGVPAERRILLGDLSDYRLLEDAPSSAAPPGLPFAELLGRGAQDIDPATADLVGGQPWEAQHAAIDPATDVAILPFSSGTTGPPKGVQLTHFNMVANLVQSSEVEPYRGDTFVAILPMYHIYGMWAFNSYAIFHGATTALLQKFELKLFLQTVEQHRVSRLHIAPPVAVLLAKDPAVDGASPARQFTPPVLPYSRSPVLPYSRTPSLLMSTA